MLISNTQVNSYLTCQTKEYYSFRERLAPGQSHSKALTRGIVGHSALESYYLEKKEGASKEVCIEAAKAQIHIGLEEFPEFTKEFEQLLEIIDLYADYYWDEPWK